MRMPFKNKIANDCTAALAFVLGAYFDLTAYRLDPASSLAGSGPFLLVCRVLGGLILAVLALALLRAGGT